MESALVIVLDQSKYSLRRGNPISEFRNSLNNHQLANQLRNFSRHQGSIRIENEQEKTIRLFVVISRETSEQELLEDFRRFGEVDYVTILRDKLSKESKGFAYVKFFR